MKYLNWNNILNISFSFIIFRISINIINYLFDGLISNNSILNFSLLILGVILIFLLSYYFLNEEIEMKKKLFLSIFLSLLVSSFLLMFFELFLHNYVDVDYKNRIANQQVERQILKIKEIEEKKNVTMDFDSDEMRNKILEKYNTKGIIGTLPYYLFFSLLYAFILNIILKMQHEITKEHKKKSYCNMF